MTLRQVAPPRWWTSLWLVLAFHAAMIGAWVWRTDSPPLQISAPPDAVMVELAPLPEAPASPPVALPPGPSQREQQQARQSVPPPLALPPERAGDVTRTPPSAPITDTEPADAANVAQSTAPPSVQAPDSERSAAATTVAGRRDATQVTWQSLLLGRLQQFRRYPRQAERLRQQGTAFVRFSVDHAGAPSAIHLAQSSGHPLLDEETLATVKRAAPLPPPPAGLGGGSVEVMVPVEFVIDRRAR